ncbi:hypothetical protein PCANC_02806 [Puccinia coronata f. sp. avenae]|uniref:Uncharacterized protein n=1 Tax=Puccinia coronata f. sp. avenae TaxID=200324 RepID=A0A2N5W471_9BASI|nr:hypothetical protein PCANC_02806 [Puccinia coronata f. sp. avenae]
MCSREDLIDPRLVHLEQDQQDGQQRDQQDGKHQQRHQWRTPEAPANPSRSSVNPSDYVMWSRRGSSAPPQPPARSTRSCKLARGIAIHPSSDSQLHTTPSENGCCTFNHQQMHTEGISSLFTHFSAITTLGIGERSTDCECDLLFWMIYGHWRPESRLFNSTCYGRIARYTLLAITSFGYARLDDCRVFSTPG